MICVIGLPLRQLLFELILEFFSQVGELLGHLSLADALLHEVVLELDFCALKGGSDLSQLQFCCLLTVSLADFLHRCRLDALEALRRIWRSVGIARSRSGPGRHVCSGLGLQGV